MLGFVARISAVVLVAVALGVQLLISRSDLRAQAWVPPTPLPVLETNDFLAKFGERILVNKLLAPESMVFRGEDELLTGLMDGRIVRVNLRTLDIQDFSKFNASCEPFDGTYDEYPPEREPLCGRPLGLRWDQQGQLLVAESYSGLHRISADGKSREIIVDQVKGRKISFINDVDVANDGTVYFTETSDRWGRNRVIREIVATRPIGRLVALHPDDPHGTMQVFEGFLPTNGVALSHDERFVFFVSSPRIYRLDRATQQVSIALDNLPAVADNIRRRKNKPNHYLVGCASKRSAPLSIPDLLAPFPGFRNFLAAVLPDNIILKFIPRMGMIMELDLTPGKERVVRSWQDRTPNGIAYVSEAEEHSDGFVYAGTWHENHLVRIKAKDLFGSED